MNACQSQQGEFDVGSVLAVGSKWAVIRTAPSLIPLDTTAYSDPSSNLLLFLDLSPHFRTTLVYCVTRNTVESSMHDKSMMKNPRVAL